MSYDIDSELDPVLRAGMLSEVKAHLPGFLSAASAERGGPVNAAADLLNLRRSDFRRVLAVHALLSEPVRNFMADLPAGIRRPITESNRTPVPGRTITSGIDWAATIRYRATSSPAEQVWVTRPAHRIFDVPENQALLWVLQTLEDRAGVAAPPAVAVGQWGQEIRSIAGAVRTKLRTAWLEGLSGDWPGDAVYERLQADRIGFYRIRVANAAKYLRRLLVNPDSADLVEAMCDRFFEPTRDWQLFEIAVLLRIARALKTVGEPVGKGGMLVGGRGPFAQYKLSSTRRIRLWYQAWPPKSGPSELDDAVSYYELSKGPTRPDIIVDFLEDGASIRLIVLELKASSSGAYIGEGLKQLLGYLKDRPRLTGAEAAGWLVAPPSNSYTTKPPDGRSLWVVSSDEVAQQLKQLVAQEII